MADALPPIGSLWQECDNRFSRVVEVVHGFDPVEDKIRIKGRDTGRITWARLARFNGKSGGYKRLTSTGDVEGPDGRT